MRHEALFSVVPAPIPVDHDEIWLDEFAEPAPARRFAEVAGRLLPRAVLGVASLLLLVAAGLYAVRASYDDRVYPAVAAGGVDLGGLTQDEARAALQSRANAVEAGTIAFTHGDRTWQPTLGELGATIDIDASLDAAYGVGREEGAADRLRSTLNLVRRSERVPLVMSLDHNVLNGWFDRVDQELGLPPRDASLTIDGTQVGIAPEIEGTVIDRPAARERVLTALRTLHPMAEPLPVVAKIPTVRAGDLAGHQQALAAALSQPIELSFEGATWSLAPTDLGRFVTQTIDPTKKGADAFALGVDKTALAAWLGERYAPEINREPKDAVVGWNGSGVSNIEWSIDGVTLKADELAAQVGASFFGDHRPIDIPVDVTKPTVDSDNLDALGITTKLATGDSNFAGSDWARATNIAVGAGLLNATLVPPYSEFSFNRSIGVISVELGYVEGSGFEQGRLGKAIGGGICQVSTTMFRAALKAGLPITEWWPHDYRLGFYEQDDWDPGFDASILQPDEDPFSGGDFRFYNPSGSWLLIEAFVEEPRVYVNIYGPDLGYEVLLTDAELGEEIPIKPDIEVVDPELPEGTIKHTELPQPGVEVHFTRDVFDANGNLVESHQFWTEFKARGNVYQVSPDKKGESPAGDGADQSDAE